MISQVFPPVCTPDGVSRVPCVCVEPWSSRPIAESSRTSPRSPVCGFATGNFADLLYYIKLSHLAEFKLAVRWQSCNPPTLIPRQYFRLYVSHVTGLPFLMGFIFITLYKKPFTHLFLSSFPNLFSPLGSSSSWREDHQAALRQLQNVQRWFRRRRDERALPPERAGESGGLQHWWAVVLHARSVWWMGNLIRE